MNFRIGTRSSDLALVQTRLVCSLIAQHQPQITFDEVMIRTHGDMHQTQSVTDADWPMGGFVGAIEQALLDREIDLAVHSYKDLPTQATPGLAVVAAPPREAAHDVLVTNRSISLDHFPSGLRVGTSSPRRAAQLRHLADIKIVPIRGNVPTRLQRVDAGELDGVVLAAAGLSRLALRPQHSIDLPIDQFLPAPGQGALAVQMREGDERMKVIAAIHHEPTALAVQAERALLAAFGTGCATPLGAYATVKDGEITLHGQLFDSAEPSPVTGIEIGRDPRQLGKDVAARLRSMVKNQSESTP